MYKTSTLEICGMTFYHLIYRKLDQAAIMRQWSFETSGIQNEYGARFEEYLCL